MAKKREVPIGRAIRWSEAEIEADIEPTPANIQRNINEIINGWRKFARRKDLIEAEDAGTVQAA